METLALIVATYLATGGVTLAVASQLAAYEGIPIWKLLLGLAIGGAVLGLGRLLASQEKLSARLVVGRSVVAGGLAVGAGAILTFIPNLSLLAVCGLAAVSAVLGEQFLERIINARLAKGPAA